jgi:hypothetical protein
MPEDSELKSPLLLEDDTERTRAAATADVIRQVCHEEFDGQRGGPQVKDRAADFVMGELASERNSISSFAHLPLLREHVDAGVEAE